MEQFKMVEYNLNITKALEKYEPRGDRTLWQITQLI